MLLPPKILKKYLSVSPTGVLHVGAHRGEELPWYRSEGFGPVIWVEAQPDLARELEEIAVPLGHRVLQVCAWSESGVPIKLKVSSNGESSSLYEMGTHSEHHPDITVVGEIAMETTALRDVLSEEPFFDFLNLDLQGAELDALRGIGPRLGEVKWVYTEVNREAVYRGIPLIFDLDQWFRKEGFCRVVTVWTPHNWGDALYIRASVLSAPQRFRVVIGGAKAWIWFHSYPVRRLKKKIGRWLGISVKGLRAK